MTRPKGAKMQSYWAVIEGEAGDFQGTVPDVSGAVGAGETLEAAVTGLRESLAVTLADLAMRGEPLPPVSSEDRVDLSDLEPGGAYQLVWVEPEALNPVSLAIEYQLKRAGISKAELARRMEIPRANASRLTNPFYWGHSSATLRKVADALHAEVKVTFEPRLAA